MARPNITYATTFSLVIAVCMGAINMGRAAVPAIFIFGDSTVDVGTNNYLNGTAALANFPYNGIDFPESISTGRFSNGYNIADALAMLLGFERSPEPYLYLVNHMSVYRNKILKGVNFASAGSGILDDTGKKLWKRVVPMRKQIQQFALVRRNISEIKGEKETAKDLSKSIFILSVGSNDILDPFRLGTNLTKDHLMATLHPVFHQHLKNLYDLGARRFGILPAAPIGCCPYSRALDKSEGGDGACMTEPNEFARAFYIIVDSLLESMSSELPEMKYSLGNVYKMTKFIFKNYRSYGFKEIRKACCGSGDYNGVGYCNEAQKPNLCKNRKDHLFWDLYHPSEAATNLSALTLYYGDNKYMKPINFHMLANV
ncbi:GDSL esterase/lipase At4g16230 [Ricinus communis]|uniref:GDSL esterase/lipase At4g16230 n=1 Tax=Ricinus communis TaxID=3988 RepID=UPI00201A5D61|nr:GDSL esterase/lipase At4g16230 [Ricinus communis]